MKSLIFGDSQTIAIRDALNEDKARAKLFRVIFTGAGRSIHSIYQPHKKERTLGALDNRFRTILKRCEEFKDIYCSLGGGEHPKLWTYNDNYPEGPTEEEVFRDSDVRQYYVESFDQKISFLSALRALDQTQNITYFSSPPPPESNTFCVNFRADFFAERGREACRDPQALTPAKTRLRLWQIMEDVNKDLCEDIGINYLPVSPRALTSDGYLREDYWKDSYHGNPTYGALNLDTFQQLEAER